MCCHALFVIFGLYALFAGRVRVYGKKTVEGDRARLIGVILLAPTAILICMTVTAVSSNSLTQSSATGIDTLTVGLMIVALIAAVGLAVTAPQEMTYAPAPAPLPYSMPQPLIQQAPDAERRIMSLAEAARYLGVTEQEVVRLIESGEIEAGRLGAEYRVVRESLDNYRGRMGT
jgi:excisionase family DNA binding protein